MNIRRHCVAALLLGVAAPTLAAGLSPAARSEIDQLLSALGESPCEFYRNGDWHEATEAQEHLRTKYEALAGNGAIASAEDFIDRAGTSSSESGEAYRVRCPGEEPQPSATWLRTQLKQIRR